jgi:hypothetical protein
LECGGVGAAVGVMRKPPIMKFLFGSIESCATGSHSIEMPHSEAEEFLEDDVNYGIADCRRRLRSRRSSLRAQHPPKDGSNGDMSPAAGRVKAVIT